MVWRTYNDRDTRLIEYEDKLGIKKIAERAEVPCVPVLACLDVTSVDVNKHQNLQLDRFVLKMNHGWNDLVFVQRVGQGRIRLSGRHIVGDFPVEEANTQIRRHFGWWMTHVHAPQEWALRNVWPRVLFAEPYLPLNDDYKVFVVRGRAVFVMTLTERWSGEGTWGGHFDREWNCLGPENWAVDRFGSAAVERVTAHFRRPANLATLISYAERMVPADMTFMRIDFFQLPDDSFVLGEGAAYSAGGTDHAEPRLELELGNIFLRALRREDPA
jgi:hypothetical protein